MLSSAFATADNTCHVGLELRPVSSSLTVFCVTPDRRATSSWVRPRRLRAFRKVFIVTQVNLLRFFTRVKRKSQ